MQPKTKSSHSWLQRQRSDPYVKLAVAQGYRSRAAFKLLEINQRDNLFKPGLRVVDLGAAPGGWSQVAKACVGTKGFVVSIDILEMEPLKDVCAIRGDFEQPTVIAQLQSALPGRQADLVISDMAPNLSGIAVVDQAKAFALVEAALASLEGLLIKDGTFLVKIFQGRGFTDYLQAVKQHFRQVMIRKPKASRSDSSEVYIVAKGYQQHPRVETKIEL
ncbi:MAG: RlmE family RNA methyltransferase [Gammaproteobacteria bacterium]|nr:RlmE family RNA methyltransferase [Gammaproteobacteria bacterium]MBP9729460.1 RlmE family RNA methyltransferase [Gammaproteobacteria bacterium]